MEVRSLLFKKSRAYYAFLLLLCLVRGAINIGLLLFINAIISGQEVSFFPQHNLTTYGMLVVLSFLTLVILQSFLIRLTMDMIHDFEMTVLNRLKHAGFMEFEDFGNEKVYTVMSDTQNLGQIVKYTMNSIDAFIIILGGIVYLFTVSWVGASTVLLILGMLAGAYFIHNFIIERQLNIHRDLQNDFYRYLNDLLYGFRQLKMSSAMRNRIHDDFLTTNRIKSKKLKIETSIRYTYNELTFSHIWFLIFGIIIFILPQYSSLETESISKFLVTILYLIGPFSVLVAFIPFYTNAKISLQRMNSFYDTMKSKGSEKKTDLNKSKVNTQIKELVMEDITYSYGITENKSFQLGPLNLKLKEGELVFVVGENGSGKSTFVNLLTGLYLPKEGCIRYNGEVVTANNVADYQNEISVIFSDNYLFSENYTAHDISPQNTSVLSHIEQMGLKRAARFIPERKTIDNNLSAGQQKRLAMIYSMMDNKSLVVLDEWASEQDYRFRNFFYTELLTQFKKEGKTVVVITHDNDYFHCADRIIKLSEGNIVEDEYLVQDGLNA